MTISHAVAPLALGASFCSPDGTPARVATTDLTPRESYFLKMEATYFAHRGYKGYGNETRVKQPPGAYRHSAIPSWC